jgi:hypothetical protein
MLVRGTLVRVKESALKDNVEFYHYNLNQVVANGYLWLVGDKSSDNDSDCADDDPLLVYDCKSIATGEGGQWMVLELDISEYHEGATSDE